jgi:type VI secretion system protein ImpL
MKIYIGTGIAWLGYIALAWLTGSLLNLQGANFYLFFLLLAAVGTAGAAAFVWFQSRAAATVSGQAESGGSPQSDDEIDGLVREAESRLVSSNLAQGARLSNLPLVFVIGETGSTKTSTLLNCGLDPELIAGQVYQDNTVVPTRIANIWFARGTVFVEPGGRLLADPARWARLIQRLRPGRLRSAVGGGGQAPRAALLCMDIEAFTRPGAQDALTISARNLQARLAELSELSGISLPVYLLFTKLNRIAFFEDFVRNLTSEEATEIFGATLPLQDRTAGGVYAEEETRRLTPAFESLSHSLADHRISFLPRENDAQALPGAYEFPREFSKLRAPLVQFLVDVCRPSQLRASQFLRGFYFSGVRPVIVHTTPAAPQQPRPAPGSGLEQAASATRVFQTPGSAAQPALQPSAAGPRKVPQWLFLSHLFNDILLRDELARGTSTSSTKASAVQRALLAAAAVLCLVYAIGFTVSFFGNRALQNEVVEAAKGIPAAEASGMNLPTPDALQRLERLRDCLARLTAYETEGAPWRLRWFLYSGDDMYPQVRRVYYSRFHQLLFGQTQAEMINLLQRLRIPPEPTDNYGSTYDTLKAYLITTVEWKRSSSWLSPVLVGRWAAGRQVEAILPLARTQFDFYSEDLVRGNPFSEKAEDSVVDRARLHLSKFAGIEQIYQFMLADASRRSKKVNFNEQFPGSAAVVVNNRDIQGAFTKPGWAAMMENIKRADKFFGGERWVLGDYAAAKPDPLKLEEELRARFTADYIARWREFLQHTAVLRYSSLADAVTKLNALSSAQTPLMALFWVLTQNTAVDSAKVTEAFDAPHKVVPPPATVVQYVWPTNQEYMGSLANLQTTISQVAEISGPPDPGRAMPVRNAADTAKNIVKKMGYTFRIDPEAHLETTTLKLLNAPIDYIDALTRGMGAGEINAKAKQLCVAFGEVANKFPFNPTATPEATLEEVNAIFRPQQGKLWVFYEETLRNFLQKQGNQYVPNPSGGLTLNPVFVNFFNQAARFSEALYPGGAQTPTFRYALQSQKSDQIKEMSLTIDGQTAKFSGQGARQQYVWPGTAARNVRLDAKLSGGSDFEFQNREGLWAAFRFFADADRWSPVGSAYTLEWVVRQGREGRPVTVGGKELTYQFVVETGGAPPVFQKEFLNSLRCVSVAAK